MVTGVNCGQIWCYGGYRGCLLITEMAFVATRLGIGKECCNGYMDRLGTTKVVKILLALVGLGNTECCDAARVV